MMNKYNFIDSDMTFEDVKTSLNDNFYETKVNNSNRFLLTTMLIGATLVMPNTNFASENLITNTDNYISVSQNYDKNISSKFEGYIDAVSVIDLPKISKQTIIKDILSYKTLVNSWDGYGALPLETLSAINTINLIDLIGEKTFGKITNYYPNPNGTISLEWENNSNEILSIEVGNNSLSYFVELSSQKVSFHNNISINAKEIKKISKIIEVL